MELNVEFSFDELRRLRVLVGTKIKGCRWMLNSKKISDPTKLEKATKCYEAIYYKVNTAFPEQDQKSLTDFIADLEKGYKKGYKK